MGRRPLVELRKVSFTYPNGVEALTELSLQIWPGELVALVGENGSGKTTLARLISGLIRPTTGSITLDGLDLTEASRREICLRAGLVFQNPDHQIFEKTVWDEVAFGPRNQRMSTDEMELRVADALRRHDLWSLRQRLPTSLSGGERKSVAFASTFVLDPAVLLLDEPTKGMDYGRKMRLSMMARELCQAGKAVVLITHDLEYAYEATERTVVLHRGRKFLDGPTQSILSDPLIEEAGLRLPPLVGLATELEDLEIRMPLRSVDDLCTQLKAIL